jgi:hypothetical protein
MPYPIRPNGIKSDIPDRGGNIPMTVDMLSQMLGDHSSLLMKDAAEVSDSDAEVVFSLWEKSTILRDASNIEDRLYKIPKDVASSTLMRLKTRGLIYGEKEQIKFTTQAAKIIKMMVLSENNAFGKKSVKKPYSVILAEIKSPKRKSNLALASAPIDLSK